MRSLVHGVAFEDMLDIAISGGLLTSKYYILRVVYYSLGREKWYYTVVYNQIATCLKEINTFQIWRHDSWKFIGCLI